MASLLAGRQSWFWPLLLIAPLAIGALGAVAEMLVLRRIYAREHLAQLLATFALFYIFADLAQQIWGNAYRSVAAPPLLAGAVMLSSHAFPIYSVFVIAVAAVVGAGLFALLRLTMFGRRLRAAVEDPELLAASGADVRLLSTLLFALGAALAGLAGAVVAPLQAVSTGIDSSILISAFIVSIIGAWARSRAPRSGRSSSACSRRSASFCCRSGPRPSSTSP